MPGDCWPIFTKTALWRAKDIEEARRWGRLLYVSRVKQDRDSAESEVDELRASY
jgi:hypothetical protein